MDSTCCSLLVLYVHLGLRASPWWEGRATGWQTQLAAALALRLCRYGDAPADLTPETALREVISVKDLYSQEPANFAPYNPAKLKVCRGETERKPAIGLPRVCRLLPP